MIKLLIVIRIKAEKELPAKYSLSMEEEIDYLPHSERTYEEGTISTAEELDTLIKGVQAERERAMGGTDDFDWENCVPPSECVIGLHIYLSDIPASSVRQLVPKKYQGAFNRKYGKSNNPEVISTYCYNSYNLRGAKQ